MKKRIGIIVLLLVTVISYGSAEKLKESDQEVLSNAFEDSKSRLELFNTSYYGKTSDKFLSLNQLEKNATEYIKLLDIEKVEKQTIEEDKMNQVSIYGQVEEGEDITLVLYSYSGEEGKTESTIFIDVAGNEDYKKLADIGSKVEKTLKKQSISMDNTSCIIGTYEGQLKDGYKMRLIEKLIASTKSKQVESMVEEDIMSYSLYSENIDNYIYSGKNKVNLNIAIRYNEYRDESYIFIATPIITMGY